MPDPDKPPTPEPGSEWEWNDKGEKKKLGLCLHGTDTCDDDPKPHDEGVERKIWCVSKDKCIGSCFCWLFHAKKGDKEWKPVPRTNEKHNYDPEYFYICFCVRIL